MTEMEWMDTFGDNLKSYLEDYRMTQNELAEEMGVSKSCISAYINKQKMPTLKNAINMAYVFGVSLDELVDFYERID